MSIKILTKSGDIFREVHEVLIIPLEEEIKTLQENLRIINKELGEIITEVLSAGDFTGKHKELLLLRPKNQSSIKRLLLLGLGAKADINLESIRQAAGEAATYVRNLHIEKMTFHLPAFPLDLGMGIDELCRTLAESSILALYTFEQYKKSEPKEKKEIKEITLWVDKPSLSKRIASIIPQSQIIAQATCYARDLVNQPSNIMVPQFLASEAEKLAADMGFEYNIIDEEEMKKLKMGAFISVAQGSREPSKLIILKYNFKQSNLQNIALLGKGVTFDAGGLCLKPDKNMWEMKGDMAGAAVVLATLKAAAQLKLPLKLSVIIPATENMPSGSAARPGDVARSYSGKTIEIINTDAEGRLILADALSYALNFKPDVLIDVATLTGACVIALGNIAIGLLGNNDTLKQRIKKAGETTYERVWELPLWKEYYDQIKSDIADIKNVGGKKAGAITAAAFLSHFVKEIPWAHLDIAGVFWYDKSKPYIPKGATGIGVRLLIELLSNWEKL